MWYNDIMTATLISTKDVLADPTIARGRMAVCSCGREASSEALARQRDTMYQFRGERSVIANRSCVTCGYFQSAHELKANGKKGLVFVCDTFTPREAYDKDTYYCGCIGGA